MCERFGQNSWAKSYCCYLQVRKRNMPEGVDGVENGTLGYSPRMDDVLPAGLEFRDEGELHILLVAAAKLC